MDATTLAQLPLATLALAAVFWILIQILTWGGKHLANARVSWTRRSRLLYHAQFSYAVLSHGLNSVISMAKEELEAKNNKSTSETAPDQQLLDKAQAAFRSLFFGVEEQKSTHALDNDAAFAVTDGFLNSQDVADNLHLYRADRAGLVLYLIEEQLLIKKLFSRVNKLATKPDERDALIGELLTVQFSIFGASLVAKALVSRRFHKKLLKIVRDTSDLEARARAIRALALAELPELEQLHIPKTDDDGLVQIVPIQDQDLKDYLDNFRTGTFDVMVVKAPFNWALVRVACVVGSFLFMMGVLLVFDPVRDFLYPDSETISCEVQRDTDGALLETKCTFEAGSLQEGFDRVQSNDSDQ